MTTDPDAAEAAKVRLVDYLYGPVADAIRSWQPHPRQDIYGIWLNLHMAEDNAAWPCVAYISNLSDNYTTPELAANYSSRWAPGCTVRDDAVGLDLCDESGAWYGDSEYLGDVPGRALRDAYFNALGLGELPFECFGAFIAACADVIRRLHREGVVEETCGRPVPIGITWSNDSDHPDALPMTRDSNPPGISRGMEEWMMGMTYEQKEGREAYLADVAARPLPEQARFWVDAFIALNDAHRMKEEFPLVERLRRLHINSAIDFAAPFAPYAVPLLLETAEKRAVVDLRIGRSNDFIATDAVGALGKIGSTAPYKEAVSEADVMRLHALLARLFRESERLARIGVILFHLGGSLHRLRPEKYPAPKAGGGGAQANRLLNWREFGLERSNPHTPDYHPDRNILEGGWATFCQHLQEDAS